jgi:hypothetical protein
MLVAKSQHQSAPISRVAIVRRADAFSRSDPRAEPPLVLVRQREWINAPKPGNYEPKNGERLCELQVEWLAEGKRASNSIAELIKNPRPVRESATGEPARPANPVEFR